MSSNTLRKLVLVPLALLALALSACFPLDVEPGTPTLTPEPDPVPTISQGDDYYTVLGTAQREYGDAGPEVFVCDLDELERAVCAYGELTGPAPRDEERGPLPDPAGWPTNDGERGNAEVSIPALDDVEGSKDTNGWFYNRSHMVADSLGGPEVPGNLVTGTRTQNVGTHQEDGQYAGGMAYGEKMARDYLASGQASTCPLYYAATPVYTGDELIPRTVLVDIQSCDKSIDERVEVSNTANGWEIDYFDGSYAPASAG
ncbi:deoxyribonuclease-like [Tenebrio molitor]|uniref:deoxyribonuclease-like n=1 Tax=Tenebrio molitor TaxID=7067 RepID=UPI0036247A6C